MLFSLEVLKTDNKKYPYWKRFNYWGASISTENYRTLHFLNFKVLGHQEQCIEAGEVLKTVYYQAYIRGSLKLRTKAAEPGKCRGKVQVRDGAWSSFRAKPSQREREMKGARRLESSEVFRRQRRTNIRRGNSMLNTEISCDKGSRRGVTNRGSGVYDAVAEMSFFLCSAGLIMGSW